MIERTKRWLYFSLGWVFVALGALGVVLPVLPTTPFMLLALWCFARSSQRFHDWLYHHALFGPPLQAWEEHGVIPLKAKIVSITFMTASMVYVTFFTNAPVYSLMMMAAVIAYGAWFILTKPSQPPAANEAEDGIKMS